MDREILQDGTGNYLRVSGGRTGNFSDRIFSYQDIRGFLPLEVRRINGEKEYIYDISGKLSLKKFLDRSDFSLDSIRHLFGQIFDMAECMEEYLLDSRGVVIQEDFLYLDTVDGEWSGVYQEDNKQEIAESVGNLLELIMEKMDQKDRELVFFVYGMHKLTREAGCTRDILREYVSKYGDSGQNTSFKEAMMMPGVPESDFREIECLPKDRPRPRQFPAMRGWLLPGMILAAGITLPAILWWMGMFRLPLSGGTDWIKAGAAVLFFLAVSGYGVWKTMPDRTGKKEGFINFHQEENEQKKVCLIPQMGSGAPVPIPQFPYRLEIGRKDKESSDYMRILQEAGVVMVVDEESAKGAFHNNRRLVPWQKIPIQDGDILQFDNKEYVVEIT